MRHVLFISDLHLSITDPEKNTLFLKFLEEKALQADSLYILGDFFDFWVGDDIMGEFEIQIAQALKKLVDHKVPIYLMHGNRDFLLGKIFCQQSGCRLIPDPSLITIYGQHFLIAHGDGFCTDDRYYLYFRKILRSHWLQWLFLKLPLKKRLAIANQIRAKSQQRNQSLSTELMDVNESTILKLMTNEKITHCIHGHTHRPGFHLHFLDSNNFIERIVLSDWGAQQGNMLLITEELQFLLLNFS